MFQKISCQFVVLMICSPLAFAGPASRAARGPFEGYAGEVAEQSGRTEREVREEAIRILREYGNNHRYPRFKEADLGRIGRKKVDLSPAKQNEIVSLLKWGEWFDPSKGIFRLNNEAIGKDARSAFETMKRPVKTHAGREIKITPGLLQRLQSIAENEITTAFVLVHPELTNIRYIERLKTKPQKWSFGEKGGEGYSEWVVGPEVTYQESDTNVPRHAKLKNELHKAGIETLSKVLVPTGYYLMQVQGTKQALVALLSLKTTVYAAIKMSKARAESEAGLAATSEYDWITRRVDGASFKRYKDELAE